MALLVVGVICGTLYYREAGLVEQRLRERELGRNGSLAQLLISELRPTANDLRTLASGEGLAAYLATNFSADRERIVKRAVAASRQQPSYDSIAFLDARGNEVVHVRHGGVIVPEKELQNKSGELFFQKARSLAPGQLTVSAVEAGQNSATGARPSSPLVRFAMPVFDDAGAFRGVFVIGFLGEEMIARLYRAAPLFTHRLRLVNALGAWLDVGAPPEQAPAVVPTKANVPLARSDPTLWARVLKEPAGQSRYQAGLFTWRRIEPRDFAGSDAVAASQSDEFLLLASEVNAPEWEAIFSGVREIFLVVTPCLIALVASSAWFFRARQRAVAALRQNEEDLAVTLESIGDAVLATDRQGRITRMNQVGEQLTGWSSADAVGRPIAEVFRIVSEENREPSPIPVAKVLATGEAPGLANHTVLIARDGTERSIAERAAPIRDRAGEIVGVVLVFRDVTEQRASEAKLAAALEELARERQRLQRVFDCVPVGICFGVTKPDGEYTRLINDAHLDICGITRAQGDERDIFVRLTHPEDREYQRPYAEQLEAKLITRGTIDKRYIRPDGRTVWVMLSFQREHYSDGSYDDLSIVMDITERKMVEQRIHRQNARLRALFETLPGLYLVLAPDLTIVTATDAFLKAAMVTREAIMGRPIFEVFPDNPNDPTATGVANLRSSLERVRHSLAPDTMSIQKYDVRRRDGTFEERYWTPTNSAMIGLDGELEYLIHRVEDVTDFVRQRNRSDTTGDGALRTRMEQMEAEIFASSQKVQVANAELRAALAELESFSYSVSHDLRAPLRHIQGYVDMLAREAEGTLSDKGQRYLKTITDVSREMGQLIENLLAFSRMGRVEMSEGRVSLDRLVQVTRQELESAAKGRAIIWKIAPLPDVQGDVAMLKQVFVNLLGNAIKYTRSRDPAVIEVGCEGEEDGRVIVFVKDNGAGFDMKYAAKLFGVFQRLHHAGEFEGNGIGLASVRRIITRHGGRAWGVGAPDAGATFYITLKKLPGLPTVSQP